MKTLKLFSVIVILFLALKTRSQSCQVGVTYTTDQTGYTVFESSLTGLTAASNYTCYWDLGNGVNYTTNSITQTVSTTYTINSLYKYMLYIESLNPSCATGTTNYVIMNTPCLLNAWGGFPMYGVTVSTPTVAFTNASTNTVSATTYTWDFGDGTSSNLPNPVHVYSNLGSYQYTILARNDGTCASFITKQLTVCGYVSPPKNQTD